MVQFESFLYQFASLFMLPVMVLILASMVYALFVAGQFVVECAQRRSPKHVSRLGQLVRNQPTIALDDIELWIMKALEMLRMVSRITPMLGLVATMIAIGPALIAMGDGRGDEVASQMVVAFSAVILALVASSITFWVMTIRRRWLLEELRAIERGREQANLTPAAAAKAA
ncbi:MotA/TolQ/ExbB proton channel family protein [Ferrimonas marina]|uniref:Biopolymer transport protein ExbB/TolQ n=1 Tax=Ferrimonas marina TaxID=299255 RepID=A0A1M5MTE0_9GAMM|nr:MotA/TolQ/ExbB proton channel family protein [Ferrimonas marina]SHG80455.1 Biopolymer transport protein ExbB/TolQ [Ferrimonas marina]